MTTPSSDLTSLLDDLAADEPVLAPRFALLSDLSTEERVQLEAAWPSIPAESRCLILAEATELAGANVELDFDHLACVGMSDPDPVVRRLAVETAWESTSRRIATELARLVLSDPEPEVRFTAAEALGGFVLLREYDDFDEQQGDQIVAVLRGRVSDPNEAIEVRARSLVSVSARSEDWVGPVILEAYYSDERVLRLAALEAMGETASEEWLEYIDEQLLADDAEFRAQAAASAAEIASAESIEALAPLLDDPEPDVALAAVTALGEIGGPEAVEYLEEYRSRMMEDVAEAVAAALEMARNPWRSNGAEDEWEEDEDE